MLPLDDSLGEEVLELHEHFVILGQSYRILEYLD